MSDLYFDAWGLTPVGQQLLVITPPGHDEDFFQKLLAYIGKPQASPRVSNAYAIRHEIQ